jgi:hypothetical protein
MKKLMCLIFLFFNIYSVFSQETFKGDYNFNNLEGYSEFQFKVGPEQTVIKEGKFKFSRFYVDSVRQSKVYKNLAEGSYKNNLKEGNWIYKNEEHEIFVQDVKDFKVISKLESYVSTLAAGYKSGIPHGIWNLKTDRYVDGKLEPSSSAEKTVFKDGYITGDLQFKTIKDGKTFFINGKLSDLGEMDGEWRMVYEQNSVLISENRKYEKGFLLGLVKRDIRSGEILEEVVFFSTIEKLNQIKNNQNEGFEISDRQSGVRYNDGFRKRAEEYHSQLNGNAFIESFFKQLLQFENGEYLDDDGEFLKHPVFTRRFVYELSKEDKIRISEIPAIFQKLQTKTNTFANMNSLALNKSKSDSLAFVNAFFKDSELKFQNFENLIGIIESGRIEFYDLKNYIQSGLEYISSTDTIRYEFNDEQRLKVINFRKVIENQENFLRDFAEYLNEELELVNSLGDYVEQELFIIEQDEDIRLIEAEILSKKKYVDSIYFNHNFISMEESNFLNEIRQNFLGEVYDSFIEEYGNMEVYADKMNQSQKILDLLNELEEQFENLVKIFPAKESLDELYLEEVFNPFTYSRYNQRVKNRLFENGGMKLFDFYLRQIKDERDYTRIKDLIMKIENLHNRMLELRNQDTRKLERKIRNNLSPGKIESLLGL